jgi:hypothetical protein
MTGNIRRNQFATVSQKGFPGKLTEVVSQMVWRSSQLPQGLKPLCSCGLERRGLKPRPFKTYL